MPTVPANGGIRDGEQRRVVVDVAGARHALQPFLDVARLQAARSDDGVLVLAATVFHFGTLRISEVKAGLAAAGHLVR